MNNENRFWRAFIVAAFIVLLGGLIARNIGR